MTPEQREELKTAAQDVLDAIRFNMKLNQYDAAIREFDKKVTAQVVLSIIAQVEALTAGLDKIIEMNRFTAEHQYGNAEKAESWSCVKVARDALNGIHPAIPAAPQQQEKS